ncbi:MAG: hypothetical protein ABIR62_06565, partial [Dokdonella sp.]|uniref:hypothetical protein n=1 Tax=Dokdonella sp. TaxID=2291710 RepID=UPI003265A714
MQSSLFGKIALVAGIVLTGLILHVVKDAYGQAAVHHIIGGILMGVAAILAFRPGISIYSGFRKVGELTGWRKAIVLLP